MAEEKKQSIPEKIKESIKGGDRTIWLVFVILLLFSVVAIFSSTSTMAMMQHTTRTAIFKGQVTIVAAGFAVAVLINCLGNLKWLRGLSRWGFIGSLILLFILLAHIRVGSVIRTETINGACRSFKLMGFSVSVYEVVKVAMVMYLAWAVQAYGNGRFPMADRLALAFPERLGKLKETKVQRWVYIFIPMLIITAMVLKGSTGSAALTFITMVVTIVIGGMPWKHIWKLIGVGAAGAALVLTLHIASNGIILDRLQTVFSRVSICLPYPDAAKREAMRTAIAAKNIDIDTVSVRSKAFTDYKEKVLQPKAAEIAIVQGGRRPLGKGPGKSTQRYKVPVMYEDYMFSLIVEEYGLIVSFLLILLYMSLFARGSIIVHNSTNRYAQATVGGLCFLITFQALFHVMVNCNIGIVTGQTLPLISHGKCSFLVFCFAFGVILNMSVLVNRKIKKQQEEEAKIMESKDDVAAAMDVVESIDDTLENGGNEGLDEYEQQLEEQE